MKRKKPTCKQKLAAVVKALEEMYADFDCHANTDEFMMRECLSKIEKALDMWWGKDQGK